MIKKRVYIISLAIGIVVPAQVIIAPSTPSPVPKASAALEVTNVNNRAVLLPRVDILDITNSTNPIKNPAQGLIVYNLGNAISKGIYIWNDFDGTGSRWNLLADTKSTISYTLIQNNTPFTVLSGVANGAFVSLLNSNFSIFSTDFGATVDVTNGITLPASSKYLVNLCFNVITSYTNEYVGKGFNPGTSSDKNVYIHNYVIKLLNPTNTAVQYGDTVKITSISSGIGQSNTNNGHIINASFAITNNTSSTITIFPYIAYGNYDSNGNLVAAGTVGAKNGGNYYSGTATTNTSSGISTGAINITNAKIDIQRIPIVN